MVEFCSAAHEWVQWIRLTCRASTVRMAKSCVRNWVRTVGGVRLSQLTAGDLIAAFAARQEKVKTSTLAKERRVFRWFWRWVIRKYHVQDLRDEIPSFRPHYSRPRTLSPEECARLIDACPHQLRPLVVVAIETGLRRGTLLSLRWNHVDLLAGRFRIPAEFMKGGQEYRAPMSSTTIETLRSVGTTARDPSRIFPFAEGTFVRRWEIARSRAGFPGLRFHDLRKTFLTLARRRGVQLEVAMALSDHRDVRVALSVYRMVDDDELLRAVGRLPMPVPTSAPTT